MHRTLGRISFIMALTAMAAAMALCLVVAEPASAEAKATPKPSAAKEPSQPKLYKADKKLGAYLDRQLLQHKRKIVFHTRDRYIMSPATPTGESRLEYCSIMLYGIKHRISLNGKPVVHTSVEVIRPEVEGGAQQTVVRQSLAYYRVTLRPRYRYSKRKARRFYNRIKRIARRARRKKGVRRRAAFISDYIVRNVKYSLKTAYNNTAYAAVMKGRASCQGYSDMFTLIARHAGLKVETVVGYAWYRSRKNRGYHAWNIVKRGRKWVQIDTTFNDSFGRRRYFMVRKKKFNRNHKLDMFYRNKAWRKKHPIR